MPEFAAGQRKISSDFAGRASAIRNLESEIRVLERDLEYLTRDGTTGEIQSARLSLSSKQNEIAKLGNEYKQHVEAAKASFRHDLRLKLSKTVRQIAVEEGFDLILTDGVYFSSPRINITQKLIRRVSGN